MQYHEIDGHHYIYDNGLLGYDFMAHTDGGTIGLGYGCKVVIAFYDDIRNEGFTKSVISERQLNNHDAELMAIEYALGRAKDLGCSSVKIFSDSNYIVGTIQKAKKNSKKHCEKVKNLIEFLDMLDIDWVSRESNHAADCLCKLAKCLEGEITVTTK